MSATLLGVLKLGVEAIKAHCPPGLEEVHMVGFSDDELATLTDVANDVFFA